MVSGQTAGAAHTRMLADPLEEEKLAKRGAPLHSSWYPHTFHAARNRTG